MTSYQITPAESGMTIELNGVGGQQQQLLAAFGECQAGQCSCPTTEYEKVEAMDVEPSDDAIAIRLRAKPGHEFDSREIGACLDHIVEQADGAGIA